MAPNTVRKQGSEPFTPKAHEDVVKAAKEIRRRQDNRERLQALMNDRISGVRKEFAEAARLDTDEIRLLSEGIRPWLGQYRQEAKLTPGQKETVSFYMDYLDRMNSFEFSEGGRRPGGFNIEKLEQTIAKDGTFEFILPGPGKFVNFSDPSSIAETAEKMRVAEEKAGRKLGAVEAVRRVMAGILDFSDATSIALAAVAFQELEAKAGRNISAVEAVGKVIEKK